MGYTLEQKINICLKAEANSDMTQADLANWAKIEYGSSKAPSQTTISRILSSKNDLIATKSSDFNLVRRRKHANPLLRRILTEWITQAIWEKIPITVPIIQSTASAIWNRLPAEEKDGNGIFNQKWCNHFIKKLNINITGSDEDISNNPGNHAFNKIWRSDDRIDLKSYLNELIKKENYTPQDIFTIDEFQLFYSLPLDQIFDVSSIDKGLNQSKSSTENSLTIMLGCNIDGSEKLTPLVVGKFDKFSVSKSSNSSFKNFSVNSTSQQNLMNKITEVYDVLYKSNNNKWITSSMFQSYLLTMEHKLSSMSPNRKILILLDDSSSHRIINLKFKNIRLCYLKNNASQANAQFPSQSGARFDYLSMSFGIIEEFKILYRLQQYLEMINLQRLKSKINSEIAQETPELDIIDYKLSSSSSSMEVLAESDYHIPLIRVIEWIKRSWDSISQERIFMSWKRTYMFNFNNKWPSSDSIISSEANTSLISVLSKIADYDYNKSYKKLVEIMGFLSVVIPWEADELLALVNERGKVRLNYVSIEEIIGSCLSETLGQDSIEYSGESSSNRNDLTNENRWLGSQTDNNQSTNPLIPPTDDSLTTSQVAIDSGYEVFPNSSMEVNSSSGMNLNSLLHRQLPNSSSLETQKVATFPSLGNLNKFDVTKNDTILSPTPPYLPKSPMNSYVSMSTRHSSNASPSSLGKHKLENDGNDGNIKKKLSSLPNNDSGGFTFPISMSNADPRLDFPVSTAHMTYPSTQYDNRVENGRSNFLQPSKIESVSQSNKEIIPDTYELISILRNFIDISTRTTILRLSPNTINELKLNLSELEQKLAFGKVNQS